MKFSRENTQGYSIIGYAPGQVRVRVGQPPSATTDGTLTLTHSVIISSDDLIQTWPPQHLDELQTEHLTTVLALQPEVILLGTGETLRFPDSVLLANTGVGIEVMDTGAACRTFNILVAEGRRVVAAIFMI
ncbi:MAG: Mth938-like domain-containing protein [Gammaproteobacteria bacterium]|nr:Mth938-like domain-containing protein [Gammaproteobacteria bacterium]